MYGAVMAHPGGSNKYKPEMLNVVIELMREGASKVEVCAEIGIDKATFYRWCDPKSDQFQADFCDTVTFGEQLCQAWWEKLGRTGTQTDSEGKNKVNPTMYIFNMKNRFKDDWKDMRTSENTGANGGPIQIQATDRLANLSDEQLSKLEDILATE